MRTVCLFYLSAPQCARGSSFATLQHAWPLRQQRSGSTKAVGRLCMRMVIFRCVASSSFLHHLNMPIRWCFVVSCGFHRRHQNSGTCHQNVRPCQFGKRKDKTKNSTTGGNLAREDSAVGIVSSEIGFAFFFLLMRMDLLFLTKKKEESII